MECFLGHFEVPNTFRQRLDAIDCLKSDFEKIEKKSFFEVDLALKYEVLSFGPWFFLTGVQDIIIGFYTKKMGGPSGGPPWRPFLHISKLMTDFLDVSKKSPERFQRASKHIPVDSLNSEKHSTYLQKCQRTRRSDSRAILGGAVLSKS